MYRTPEIVDLYSNFPIGEKQDIWVSRLPAARGQPRHSWRKALGRRLQPAGPLSLPSLFLLACSSFFSTALVMLLAEMC